MSDQDWRFKNFGDTNDAYNRTLAVDTPASRAQFNAGAPNVNAASRVIPSPSGTNWNATFGAGRMTGVSAPTSPSGTNWAKTFPGQSSNVASSAPATTGASRSNGFAFNLSPGGDRPQLSLGTDATDFYKDRVANMDLTRKDHTLYGAGEDYGFNY